MSNKEYHTFKDISWTHKVHDAYLIAKRDIKMKIKMNLWPASAVMWLQEFDSAFNKVCTRNGDGNLFNQLWNALDLDKPADGSTFSKRMFWSVEVFTKAGLAPAVMEHMHRDGVFVLTVEYLISSGLPVEMTVEVPCWDNETFNDMLMQAYLDQDKQFPWRVKELFRVSPKNLGNLNSFCMFIEYAGNIDARSYPKEATA